MEQPTCLLCASNRRAPRPVTFAFVTVFGSVPPHEVLATRLNRAQSQLIPGVTGYCCICRRATILSTQGDLQEGLIEHELLYAKWGEVWKRQTQSLMTH